MLAITAAIALLAGVAQAAKLHTGGDRNLCVAIEGQWDGAKLHLQPCSSNMADVDVWSLGDGKAFWEFKAAGFGGPRVLDVADGRQQNGAVPQIWGKSLNSNQKFQNYWTDGGVKIATSLNYCLDVPNGNFKSGQKLQWYACASGSGNKNQMFYHY